MSLTCFPCINYALTRPSSQALLKRFVALGTKCAEYLKLAKASEGMLDILSLLFLYASFCCLFDFLSIFVGLQML
jgi:hypothetical protein